MTDADKKQLRLRYRSLRDSIPFEVRRSYDVKGCSEIAALDIFRKASSLLLFASIGSEPDLSPLFEEAKKLGIPVGFPRCGQHREMKFFQVTSLTADELSKGSFGISEPVPSCPEIIPDTNALCIVPGLVFDSEHCRIGYGGGFYDRYLSLHPMHTLSLVYPELLSQTPLPKDSFDLPVDTLIIP